MICVKWIYMTRYDKFEAALKRKTINSQCKGSLLGLSRIIFWLAAMSGKALSCISIYGGNTSKGSFFVVMFVSFSWWHGCCHSLMSLSSSKIVYTVQTIYCFWQGVCAAKEWRRNFWAILHNAWGAEAVMHALLPPSTQSFPDCMQSSRKHICVVGSATFCCCSCNHSCICASVAE